MNTIGKIKKYGAYCYFYGGFSILTYVFSFYHYYWDNSPIGRMLVDITTFIIYIIYVVTSHLLLDNIVTRKIQIVIYTLLILNLIIQFLSWAVWYNIDIQWYKMKYNGLKQVLAYTYLISTFLLISYFYSLFLHICDDLVSVILTFIFGGTSCLLYIFINKYIIRHVVSSEILKHINLILLVNVLTLSVSWFTWLQKIPHG